ncbi:type ISP restriction/modification enzyme [Brevundimonas sp.]|uniref:type ISP restriction/modification enzyme n=1 Tax=Brevundimonas sp. TaxID=1871086 RepID=UPI0022CC2F12|nr:type ISP restriction/modification enzyme [Brevundimonas sp.]MCZ8194024.1 N-6 DNA methylase [Brevundimonas sp.]
MRLIERLAQSDPPQAKDAEHLAELLAYSAKLVRGIVRDRLAELAADEVTGTPLHQVRQEFRDVLYSHPEAGGYSATDFDDLFSSAFAQTLAFGLLLVREATGGKPVDRNAYEQMPKEHPLMRTALRVLSLPEVAAEVGIGFQVMLQTVNGFDPNILTIRKDGSDPILYFYEFFLETFDPAARERYGVYYTPVEVVRFMVGALDRALKQDLKTKGIVDPAVHILDPATGTGTFLLGVADRLRREVSETDGPGQAPAALRGLASRMYGFELLIGPYAVAHYRLHHTLARDKDGKIDPTFRLPRLGVYLTDTLAEPNAAAPAGALGFVSDGIQDERAESNRIKTQQPILAIIGNPPYRRLEVGENESLVGRWMDGVWDDLKKPVRDAGWGNQLNTFPELSVAFWRWAMWKLFEAENAPKKGVIAFISNRKYLTGKPYAGLRKMLRERFDRIEVYDLRGDGRAGERAGVEGDQNVFNILTGVAITVAIADGSRADGDLAQVDYVDAWEQGRASQKSKLAWLLEGESEGALPGAVIVDRGLLDDMRPAPFLNGELLSVADCFAYTRGGMQTKRDDFIYAFSEAQLADRIKAFIASSDAEAQAMFHSTGENHWSDAKAVPFAAGHIMQASYRPFDRRVIYNHRAYGAYLRQDMQSLWGASNAALYAMKGGTGAGPAVWCHGLMPDYHGFRGSYGGYAFPLYDRRPGHGPHNLKPELVTALSDAYGSEVTPEAVFDVILALLSATSYTTRFAEDLEDVFPHIPFPADRAVFDAAAAVGAAIRAVQTFTRPPGEPFTKGIALAQTAPTGKLRPIDPRDLDGAALTLCENGSGLIAPIPREVWDFAVSGYRVVPRWLAARAGLDATAPDFIPQLRDLVGRVGELIDLNLHADSLLIQTLDDPLSRDSLGFASADAASETAAPEDE